MTNVPKRYVPSNLSYKDKRRQRRELKKSRKLYKKGKYHTRKKVKSFKSKTSPHILKAEKMYKTSIFPNKKLSKKTKCSVAGLKKIVKKGQGAYFSSGSRPNQTAHSWGLARLASSITGGKAAAVDYHILKETCSKKSKALKLAKKSRKKYRKGVRRVPQTSLKGGRKTRKNHLKGKMKEKIVKIIQSKNKMKKYTAFVRNISTGKERKIDFGARDYAQFKDSTKLKKYSHKDHGSLHRKRAYFKRHSGVNSKLEAILKELKKSGGHYNAKILSHVFLW